MKMYFVCHNVAKKKINKGQMNKYIRNMGLFAVILGTTLTFNYLHTYSYVFSYGEAESEITVQTLYT